jgi:hypothetical protein
VPTKTRGAPINPRLLLAAGANNNGTVPLLLDIQNAPRPVMHLAALNRTHAQDEPRKLIRIQLAETAKAALYIFNNESKKKQNKKTNKKQTKTETKPE